MNLLIGVVLTARAADGIRRRQPDHHHRRRLQVPGQGRRDRGPGLRRLQAHARPRRPASSRTTSSPPSTARPSPSWDELTGWIRASADRQVTITVERDGATVTTTVTPVLSARPVVGADGRQAKDADGNLQYQDVGFLGIGAQTALVPQPASSVLPMAGENIKQVAGVVVNLPARVAGVAKAAFSEEPRDPNGPISVVGVGRVAGEVAAMEEFRCSPGSPPWWAAGRTQLRPGRVQPHPAAAARRRPCGRRAV